MSYEIDSKVDYVNKLYSSSKNYYRSQRDDYVKDYKQYRSWLDSETMKDYYKWRSKLFIPATARAVDGLLPDLMLTIFGANPFFEVNPREELDVVTAKINQSLLNYDFDVDDFQLKFFDFLKQMAFYGTTFGKCYWRKDTREETVEIEDIILGKQKVKNEIVLFDGPCFTPLDIFNVYYSPKATKLSDTWIIHRSEKTIGEMKRQGIYKNIDELENNITMDKDTERYQAETKKARLGIPSAYSSEEGDDRRVELLEYWNIDRTKTMTIAGQSVIVRPERENPLGIGFDPFVMCSLWPNPFELAGVGIPEKVRDIQDQLNSEVNQRLDNRNLRQNLILKVRRGANVNVRNLISKPGGVWLTDDMSAIEVVSMPDISSSSSFAEENMLEGKCEEITGVTKYVTGGGANAQRTATESSILQKMGSKQFALHVKLIEEMALKPIVKKFHQLNQKFMDKEKVVRIVGQEGIAFVTATPADTAREFDFTINGATQLTDKNLKVQQMINYMQIIGPDPTMQQMKKEITRRIWEAWGYKDFESMNPPPAPQVPGMMPGMQGQQGMAPQGPQGPVEPTEMRPPTPQEGMIPQQMGGGGNAQGGGY